MFGQARARLASSERPVQACCRNTTQRAVLASAQQPKKELPLLSSVSVSDEVAVPAKKASDASNQWGGQIADLKLHTEDALFHEWKPNCRIHYLKSGTSGAPGRTSTVVAGKRHIRHVTFALANLSNCRCDPCANNAHSRM